MFTLSLLFIHPSNLVTGYEMACLHFFRCRTLLQTHLLAHLAPGREGAAGGQIDGAGDIPLQDDALVLPVVR